MNTYRRVKAKKKLRRNELVNFTTVEVFGKPVHVPNVKMARRRHKTADIGMDMG